MAPRIEHRRKVSGAKRAPLGLAAGKRRPSEGRITTGEGRTPLEINSALSPALSQEVTRTSSLLSLYEAQSVEYVAGGGSGGGGGGRDNSGPYLDDDAGTLLGLGGSISGPSYGLMTAGRRGEGVEHRATLGVRDRLQAQEAGASKASPAETEEVGDYPWSDERRARWSRGSGGVAARRPGTGDIDPGALNDRHRDELRWDDVLRTGEQDGSSAGAIKTGDSVTKVVDVSGGYRGCELEAAVTDNHASLPLPAEGADCHDRPEFPAPSSPRKLSSLQRRREYVASPTRATSPSAEADQPQLNGDRQSCNRELGGVGGVGDGGGRFSLWSSSDEDASVTEVFGRDEHGDEDGGNGNGGSGYDAQAGGPNRLASRSAAATSCYDMSGGAFLSATASAGSFFDAATSSADKVRIFRRRLLTQKSLEI